MESNEEKWRIEKFTNSTELVVDDPFPQRFHLGLSISIRHSSVGERKWIEPGFRKEEKRREKKGRVIHHTVREDQGFAFIYMVYGIENWMEESNEKL